MRDTAVIRRRPKHLLVPHIYEDGASFVHAPPGTPEASADDGHRSERFAVDPESLKNTFEALDWTGYLMITVGRLTRPVVRQVKPGAQ